MGTHEPNKLTYSQVSGFSAQLVEHCISIAEVMGSNPIEAIEQHIGKLSS